MAVETDAKPLETTETGYLVNVDDWNEQVAVQLASQEGLELTQAHWDVLHYLRDEYINNNANQPNNRSIIKDMSGKWGHKASNKELFDLFPGNPSKQAGLIAGLPESRRKGGY